VQECVPKVSAAAVGVTVRQDEIYKKEQKSFFWLTFNTLLLLWPHPPRTRLTPTFFRTLLRCCVTTCWQFHQSLICRKAQMGRQLLFCVTGCYFVSFNFTNKTSLNFTNKKQPEIRPNFYALHSNAVEQQDQRKFTFREDACRMLIKLPTCKRKDEEHVVADGRVGELFSVAYVLNRTLILSQNYEEGASNFRGSLAIAAVCIILSGLSCDLDLISPTHQRKVQFSRRTDFDVISITSKTAPNLNRIYNLKLFCRNN